MRVLVSALGTLNSTFIINFLKKQLNYVVGVDIFDSEYIQASKEVDKFYKVSSIFEMEKYENEIIEICKKEKIEYFIPIIDEEILYFSNKKDIFKNFGVKICTPDYKTVEKCRNKYKTFEIIKNSVPEVYVETYKLSEYKNEFNYPFFVKPISGRASIGCQKVLSEKHFEFIKEQSNPEEFIVQSFLEGRFIAVDFICDIKTNTFFALAREELLRNKNGCGTVVKIIKSDYIENIVKKIAFSLEYNGVGNVEFIEKEGVLKLIEVNPRFPAGIEYSVRAGADLINDEIKIINNQKIDTNYKIKFDTIFTRRYEAYEV